MFRSKNLIFRQLQESTSSTFTYILGCAKSKEAIIIDPVDLTAPRDANLIKELDLDLKYSINTHCHADHITGTNALKNDKFFPNSKSMISEKAGAKADILLKHDQEINFGDFSLTAKNTFGHTNGCMSFIDFNHKVCFTGDALMIRKCGRTDFQQGSPKDLYQNVHKHLFTLDDDFLVFPGHDYAGIMFSSIGEEKKYNLRLTKSEEEFVKIMDNLNLAYPKKIVESLPMNLADGDEQFVVEAKIE